LKRCDDIIVLSNIKSRLPFPCSLFFSTIVTFPYVFNLNGKPIEEENFGDNVIIVA